LTRWKCTSLTPSAPLSLDKILGVKRLKLDGLEWDLDFQEEVPVEAQPQGLNP
jgi:hypothetical protein